MMWRGLSYDFPSAALLLPVVGFFIWAFMELHSYRQMKLREFANETVLSSILEPRLPLSFWIKSSLCCLVWNFGVITLMQPKGNERYVSSPKEPARTSADQTVLPPFSMRMKRQEIIFLLDASRSMMIADAHGGLTREVVAKGIIDDVISHLHGESVSLFAFTSATFQIVPSTADYLFARLMLNQIEMDEGETAGTAFQQAFEKVSSSYRSMPASVEKTLIVFSDGGDTLYESLQGEAQQRELANILNPLKSIEEWHVFPLFIGLGSRDGKKVPEITYEGHEVISSLDESFLRKLSDATRGNFIIASEMTPTQVSQKILQKIADSSAYEAVADGKAAPASDVHVYDPYFQNLLGAALLLLALMLLIPNTHNKKMYVD